MGKYPSDPIWETPMYKNGGHGWVHMDPSKVVFFGQNVKKRKVVFSKIGLFEIRHFWVGDRKVLCCAVLEIVNFSKTTKSWFLPKTVKNDSCFFRVFPEIAKSKNEQKRVFLISFFSAQNLANSGIFPRSPKSMDFRDFGKSPDFGIFGPGLKIWRFDKNHRIFWNWPKISRGLKNLGIHEISRFRDFPDFGVSRFQTLRYQISAGRLQISCWIPDLGLRTWSRRGWDRDLGCLIQ